MEINFEQLLGNEAKISNELKTNKQIKHKT